MRKKTYDKRKKRKRKNISNQEIRKRRKERKEKNIYKTNQEIRKIRKEKKEKHIHIKATKKSGREETRREIQKRKRIHNPALLKQGHTSGGPSRPKVNPKAVRVYSLLKQEPERFGHSGL